MKRVTFLMLAVILSSAIAKAQTGSVTFKAKDFSLFGIAKREKVGSVDGIRMINGSSGLKFTFNNSNAISADFVISFCNGDNSRGGKLLVNGIEQNIYFEYTGGWANAKNKTVNNIQIKTGSNTVEFRGGFHTSYAPDISEIAVIFNSSGYDVVEEAKPVANSDPGVVINGVRWATRNVDAPGTFAASPESAGKFYQWNRKKAWPATGTVTGWDTSVPAGETWAKENDPSPSGWRVPTKAEFEKLLDNDNVKNEWTVVNGVTGRRFTDKQTGASIFIPAPGDRNNNDGSLANAGCGHYWGSTRYGDNTYLLDLHNYIAKLYMESDYPPSRGLSVRPVADTEPQQSGIISAAPETPAGDGQWVTFNGHRYQRIDKGMTWTEASRYCEDRGGHLVTVTSSEEQKVIEDLIKNGTQNQYWMGGYADSQRTWHWITGERWSYTNWAYVQPDNRNQNESYLQIFRVHNVWSLMGNWINKWNDISHDNHIAGQENIFQTSKVGLIIEFEGEVNTTPQARALKTDGKNVYQDGKKLQYGAGVSNLMLRRTVTAQQKYMEGINLRDEAKNFLISGAILASLGAVGLAVTLPVASDQRSDRDEADRAAVASVLFGLTAGTGAGFVIIAAPIDYIKSRKAIKKAVEIYNSTIPATYPRSSNMQFSLGITQNGLGAVLTF